MSTPPDSSSPRRPRVYEAAVGALVGLGVVAVEALAPGHPLDMPGTTLEAAGATVLIFAGLSAVDLRLSVSLWALLAWTEGAHACGGDPAVWSLGALPFVLFSVWAPRPAAAMAPVLALVVPLARPAAPSVEEVPSTRQHAGVLLVTVDTIRTDAGLLEQAVGATPAWEQTTAVTAAPWTPPAMTSLWLGQPVELHGGGIELDGRITWPRGTGFADSFPAHWEAAGLRVEAIVSNPHLRADAGFATGTAAFWHTDSAREPHLLLHTLRSAAARHGGGDSRLGRSRDARQTELAVQRLEADEADLIWVHLLEPHEYRRRGGDARRSYAAGVAATAEHLRALIAAAGDRLVIVVGDHGENLGEGGVWGHGRALTAEVLHVPLAIRWPRPAPPPSVWTLPRLGQFLRQLPHAVQLPPAVEDSVPVGALRGPLALRRWSWSRQESRAEEQLGEVRPGPLQDAPDPSTHAALHALGYMEP